MIVKLRQHRAKPDTRKPVLPAIILLVVLIVGTVGYGIIWHSSNPTFIDQLYMTFITITTIGFQEIHPLDTTGRIFTIIIAVSGIGSLFYLLSIIMENLVIIQLSNVKSEKKAMKKISELTNHIILVGFGRVGSLAASELSDANVPFVIIETSLEDRTSIIDECDYIAIEGDATEDKVLLKAGIDRAKAVIVATGDHAITLYVVLSARVLNPKIFIIARCDDDTSVEKLKRAGADRIVNPYSIGGQRLAGEAMNPNMYDFFDQSFSPGENNLNFKNIILPDGSVWIDKTMKEINIRKHTGATVLGVYRHGIPHLNPPSDFKLKRADQLITVGTAEQIEKLSELMKQE
ncbi:MAG: TrkA-N domain protein [Ignavibacteria bacterium]|nr:TrkA-N domain protein [Ignavibacteria bacterium]